MRFVLRGCSEASNPAGSIGTLAIDRASAVGVRLVRNVDTVRGPHWQTAVSVMRETSHGRLAGQIVYEDTRLTALGDHEGDLIAFRRSPRRFIHRGRQRQSFPRSSA